MAFGLRIKPGEIDVVQNNSENNIINIHIKKAYRPPCDSVWFSAGFRFILRCIGRTQAYCPDLNAHIVVVNAFMGTGSCSSGTAYRGSCDAGLPAVKLANDYCDGQRSCNLNDVANAVRPRIFSPYHIQVSVIDYEPTHYLVVDIGGVRRSVGQY